MLRDSELVNEPIGVRAAHLLGYVFRTHVRYSRAAAEPINILSLGSRSRVRIEHSVIDRYTDWTRFLVRRCGEYDAQCEV
jgi:hypothetical protein